MSGDVFKERAKVVCYCSPQTLILLFLIPVRQITKGLLEKELRKHQDEKRAVPSELSESSTKAVKKYVKEYLSRHNVNVD
jgi:hypothetical protein